MADTLQDRIKQGRRQLVRGQDGILYETSEEEIQSLAGKAGLQAPPTTAIGSAMIGAGPHSQKMAGSPAQLQAALRLSQEPTQSLQDTIRRSQARRETTAEEQASQHKSQELQGLGGLGDRVEQLIEGQRNKLAQTQVTPATREVTVEATQVAPGANLIQLKEDLAKFQTNPQDTNLLVRINQALGRSPGTPLSPEELGNLYGSTVQAIAGQGADVLQNSLSVQDLASLPEFGYDVNSLSELLGVPPEQLATYTVGQLQDTVNRIGQEEFSNVATLQQQAGSTNLGQAERALARDMGREASATGVRTAEAEFENLERKIEGAEMVTFGGREMKVDDLLKDETISNMIADYLNSPEGSSTQAQLEQTEPELVKFILDHKQALEQASKQMEQQTQKFNDIQQQNLNLGKIGTVSIAPQLMEKLVPGLGEFRSTTIDPASIPLLSVLRGIPPEQGEKAVATLNNLVDRGLGDEIASLNADEIRALQLDLGVNSPAISGYLQSQEISSKLDELDPQDLDSIVDSLFPGESADDLQRTLDSNAKARVLLGVDSDGSIFDTNRDGLLDSGESILDRVRKSNPRATLKDAAAGRIQITPLGRVEEYVPSTPTEQVVLDKLGQAALDGSISGSDIRNSSLNLDELLDIMDQGIQDNWGVEARVAVGDQAKQMIRQGTDSYLSGVLASSDMPQYLDRQDEYFNKVDRGIFDLDIDIDSLSGVISQLEGKIKQADRRVDSSRLKEEVVKLGKFMQSLLTKRDEVEARKRLAATPDGESVGSTVGRAASKLLDPVLNNPVVDLGRKISSSEPVKQAEAFFGTPKKVINSIKKLGRK